MNYVILSGTMLVLSEIGAYIWHRFGAHELNILGAQRVHDIHHTVIDDQAHFDFLYIFFFLIIYLIAVIYLVQKELITFNIGLCLYLPVLLISIYNWFIHSAYHISNHWLNRWEWFRQDKRIHFQHHSNPETNFGIATHFADLILDTFDYGLLKDI